MVRGIGQMRWIAGFVILATCFAVPQEAFAAKKKKKKRRGPSWKMDNSLTILQSVTQGENIEEKVNPENRVYQLPSTVALTEVRPEIIANRGRRYRFTLRPRLQIEQSLRERETPQHERNENKTKAFVNEAHFAWTHSAEWMSVTGLQNFQWGPAELISPSNPIFREIGLDKNYFFETRGQSLVRINYSPSGQLSMIALLQPVSNGEVRPAWDRKFHRQAALKIEYSDETQTDYIGLVVAGAEEDRIQEGLYAHYEVFPGFTAYFDFMVRPGSRAYYPVVDANGARFEQNYLATSEINHTAVVGLRYVTESAWDFRLEGFDDTTGWTLEERDNARLILAAAPTEDNFEIYTNPGTVLPGTRFAYGSLRIADIGPQNRMTLSLRVLHSLSDDTEKQALNIDGFVTDHFTMTFGFSNASGPLDGELTQGYRWTAFLAGGYTW